MCHGHCQHCAKQSHTAQPQRWQTRAGVPGVCPRKTVLTSTIMKLLVINKRRILLPSVLGTQRTELHSMRDALPHQSPGLLTEDVVLQQSRVPVPTSSPSQGCAKPTTTPAPPQLPGSNAPRAASSPCPWLRGSRVPLPGAPLGFLFLTIVSWPSVRWGQARKMNWCEQPSQAQLPPSSVSSATMGPALLGTWQRAQLPQGAARHTLHRVHCPSSSLPLELSCCRINLDFLTATHIP